ncbi:hypothetical protein L249_0313 [Ophiocordyceps polyrhachis-furcata BCC 54312]|uniref:HbrB-like protein n=1 Tax=Ophiocordyceps polyrhachis-furcata BCC 54312 TaxID=1330021 RepID=A0A367LFE7_9HYPO|nr:hypothetical protein L249_0313 [Ophiocordyceps polyrhachis-furcata BCC 54312]
MQSGQHPPPPASSRLRAIGSLSSLTGSSSPSMKPNQSTGPTRPPSLRIDSSAGQDGNFAPSSAVNKTRGWDASPATPIYNQFATVQTSASASNLHQNFSRPAAPPQLTKPLVSPSLLKGHTRKLSATQGSFDSTLPSTTTPNLPHVGMSQPGQDSPPTSLTASQMAAKAAILSHQNTSHMRQRSQTVPFPGEPNEGSRRGSGSKVPVSPPMLSLTEASAPRDSGFAGAAGQLRDRMGFFPTSTSAANVVFPRSGPSSPREKPMSPPPVPPVPPEKPPSRLDKPKVKLFSRPVKIGTSKTDVKEKALPSPGKIGTALSALQRGNFSTASVADAPSQSLYSLHNNSSSATIRPADVPSEDKDKDKDRDKDREKKHHFLSRQKQKLKDDYHLPLSSASSNSRPTDPSAPSSLYNFNVPASPGPGSTAFVKAKKDKWLAERSESRLESEQGLGVQGDYWPGPGSLPQPATLYDGIDVAKLGLQSHVTLDDAWPYLKAKLLVIFEGEDLRLPVEDFNRVVQMHIQWCINKRSPGAILEDVGELLATGFASLDRTLRMTSEDHFLPALVELWLFTFTSILPYMQAVFLPLEFEVSGNGVLMTAEQAREFWGGVVTTSQPVDGAERAALAANLLDVRRLVLAMYRDTVILPRYDTLRSMFSRLSLEFLPSSFASVAMASPPNEPTLSTSPSESLASSSCIMAARPGTAMSLDPSVAGSSCSTSTLVGDTAGSDRGRSRAVSNVSFGSDGGASLLRPFTPSSVQVLSSVREQNVEDSKQVTDMVGRMLQCMSVLSGLGDADADANRRMVELCKMLKLNWLGRGRTGRNRRGIVGGKVRRDWARDEVRVA